MKVWRFYKKPEDKDSCKKRYDLYAITNKSEFAKQFMEQRNMNLFIMQSGHCEISEYSAFANDNRGAVLDYHEFITKKETENGFIVHTDIPILSTFFEYQESNADENPVSEITTEDWWASAPFLKIYKSQLIDALGVLEYITNYKLFTLDFGGMSTVDNYDDYSAPNWWVDEVGIFVKKFKRTFK